MSRGRTDTDFVPLGGPPPLRSGPRACPSAPDADPVSALCADLEADALKGLWLVQGLADAPAFEAPALLREEA